MDRSNRICDIHAHIAPGVDDGAVDLKMALEMINMAQNQGITDIICTSHNSADINAYRNAMKLLCDSLGEGSPVKLYTGCEVYCTVRSIDMIIDDLKRGQLLTLNGTGYVLCEFSPYASFADIEFCFKALREGGYIPVFAHAERYFQLHDSIAYIKKLCEDGCLIQINAYSLANESNDAIRSYAREILSRKLASFVGSDAHRTNHRTYTVSDGIKYICESCTEDYAEAVLFGNARRLLGVL